MASKDIIQHQFKRGTSGNPNGRPKKLITTFKLLGYSKSQVVEVFSILAALTKDELENLVTDKESSAIEIAVGKAFLKSMKSGNYRLIKDIVSVFVPFAPKAAIQVNNNLNNVSSKYDLTLLTSIERQELKTLLLKATPSDKINQK